MNYQALSKEIKCLNGSVSYNPETLVFTINDYKKLNLMIKNKELTENDKWVMSLIFSNKFSVNIPVQKNQSTELINPDLIRQNRKKIIDDSINDNYPKVMELADILKKGELTNNGKLKIKKNQDKDGVQFEEIDVLGILNGNVKPESIESFIERNKEKPKEINKNNLSEIIPKKEIDINSIDINNFAIELNKMEVNNENILKVEEWLKKIYYTNPSANDQKKEAEQIIKMIYAFYKLKKMGVNLSYEAEKFSINKEDETNKKNLIVRFFTGDSKKVGDKVIELIHQDQYKEYKEALIRLLNEIK
jgi:hypothetical protein